MGNPWKTTSHSRNHDRWWVKPDVQVVAIGSAHWVRRFPLCGIQYIISKKSLCYLDKVTKVTVYQHQIIQHLHTAIIIRFYSLHWITIISNSIKRREQSIGVWCIDCATSIIGLLLISKISRFSFEVLMEETLTICQLLAVLYQMMVQININYQMVFKETTFSIQHLGLGMVSTKTNYGAICARGREGLSSIEIPTAGISCTTWD